MSKIFMSNPCGYGNCMSDECEKCPHYKPTFFGVRVPRRLGNILFRIEGWLSFNENGRF